MEKIFVIFSIVTLIILALYCRQNLSVYDVLNDGDQYVCTVFHTKRKMDWQSLFYLSDFNARFFKCQRNSYRYRTRFSDRKL
jgi:hypothetical protein